MYRRLADQAWLRRGRTVEASRPHLPIELPERPHTLVFVACAPRTGSSLLTWAMRSTGVLGLPDEYLRPGSEDGWAQHWKLGGAPGGTTPAYVDAMLRAASTPNGIAGVKVFASHLIQQMDSVFAGPGAFEPTRTRLVHLRRRDKVRAALSEWRAQRTGQWTLAPGAVAIAPEGEPSSADITRFHEFHHAWDHIWLAARAGRADVLELVYEDVAMDVGVAVAEVAEFAGAGTVAHKPDALPLRLARPGDDGLIARWVRETGGCTDCGHG